jgi:small GTP-binding protein
MDLERERGITIKLQAARVLYTSRRDGETYVLNLIDTPGHVDFSYEVSRSIAACEGALLIVDASQGIEAQTISNLYLALEHDLEIIPILNKMDLPGAMPEEVTDQIVELIGCDPSDVIPASGKTGLGVDAILSAIINRIPSPKGDENAPLEAMIFDSVFNPFRGIIAYYRVRNGVLKKGDRVRFGQNEAFSWERFIPKLEVKTKPVAPQEPKIYEKSKLVSMITSNKSFTPQQKERVIFAENNKNNIDVYGRGFNDIEKKEYGLKDYMFSVCIENSTYDTYFTEKILDCFATGTIPVYKGTKNITNYFDVEGILFFDDVIIKDLTPELYYSKIEFVKNNFEIVKNFLIPEDIIYNIIKEKYESS